MRRAEQMTHEVVHVSGLVSTPVTAPRVRVRMKSLVKEVESLVGVSDAAVGAGEAPGGGRGRGAA